MNYFWTTFFHRLEKWRAVWAEIVLKLRWYLIHFFLFDSELPQNNRYFSTVLEVCFDRAPPKKKLLDRTQINEICFDRARPNLGMFQFSNHMRYPNLDVIFYAFRITSYHAFVSEWMIIVNWNLKALERWTIFELLFSIVWKSEEQFEPKLF